MFTIFEQCMLNLDNGNNTSLKQFPAETIPVESIFLCYFYIYFLSFKIDGDVVCLSFLFTLFFDVHNEMICTERAKDILADFEKV